MKLRRMEALGLFLFLNKNLAVGVKEQNKCPSGILSSKTQGPHWPLWAQWQGRAFPCASQQLEAAVSACLFRLIFGFRLSEKFKLSSFFIVGDSKIFDIRRN